MSNYIIRKILTLIPMMLVISFLIYLGMELMPGDAVDFLILRTPFQPCRRNS